MRKITCEQCPIRGESIIADLPPEKLEAFRACGVSAIYKRRQVIFHEGTPATGLYILCAGAVKLYQSDRFGREHILGIATAGDVLGELPLDPSQPYSSSAEALTDSQLCYLARDRLVQFLQVHPLVAIRLIGALSQALSAARRKVRDLALKRAESRLAELLLQLAGASSGRPVDEGTRLMLGYSRRELAEMVGVSTETAIRLLTRLKERHIIQTRGRELTITDPERLARLADHGGPAGD